MANCLVVANELAVRGDVTGSPARITLALGFQLLPLDGTPGILESVDVNLPLTSTPAQWKTAFIAALQAFAANPVGLPATYTITRLIGFVDIISVVP